MRPLQPAGWRDAVLSCLGVWPLFPLETPLCSPAAASGVNYRSELPWFDTSGWFWRLWSGAGLHPPRIVPQELKASAVSRPASILSGEALRAPACPGVLRDSGRHPAWRFVCRDVGLRCWCASAAGAPRRGWHNRTGSLLAMGTYSTHRLLTIHR